MIIDETKPVMLIEISEVDQIALKLLREGKSMMITKKEYEALIKIQKQFHAEKQAQRKK